MITGVREEGVMAGLALLRQVRSSNIYIRASKNELKSRKLSYLNQNSDELLCNVLPAETAAVSPPHTPIHNLMIIALS